MTLSQSLADRERLWKPAAGHFWTLDRVAAALGMSRDGPRGTRSLSGVSTDSRKIAAGELFVALTGENFDGHDFLDAAIAAGAAAAIVSRPVRVGVPTFEVSDTTVALGQLGQFRRRSWAPGHLTIGVTGTNGKTGTKDLIAAALGSRLEVHATEGNLNNRIGVPLTLLAIDDHADVAVIEMGTSLPGEIAALRAIAEPDIAVVTTVAEGHLEGLGSVEGVLAEKCSIFEGAAVAITPAAQPEIAIRAKNFGGRVISVGLGEGDLAASSWGVEKNGDGWLEFEKVRVNVPSRGVHSLRNAMIALAVAKEAGVTVEEAARGIASLTARSMRLEMTPLGRDGFVLINDAYNANPGSMVAAIEFLETVAEAAPQRVLVLGGMRELGSASEELHDRVARRAIAARADLIAGFGDFAAPLRRAAQNDERVVTSTDIAELWEKLRGRLHRGATLLIKASRGERLERIVPFIKDWAET